MPRINTTLLGVAAALAITATAAPAQTIGFKLGASIATQNFTEPDVDRSSLTGFVGGGHIRFGMGRIGVQLEALSVTKGSKSDSPTGTDNKLSIEYVELPLLLHLPLTVGQSFSPYIIAGPSVALKVSCSAEGAGAGDVDCEDIAFDVKSTDFGLHVGGGIGFAAGPGAVLLEGRYAWGLSNINEGTTALDATIKNRAILIVAGYEIPIGRR